MRLVNISKEILDKVALSEKEYKLIVQQLGRELGGMALTDIGEMQKPKIKVQKYREKSKIFIFKLSF